VGGVQKKLVKKLATSNLKSRDHTKLRVRKFKKSTRTSQSFPRFQFYTKDGHSIIIALVGAELVCMCACVLYVRTYWQLNIVTSRAHPRKLGRQSHTFRIIVIVWERLSDGFYPHLSHVNGILGEVG
jgi:hypothetical protein